MSKSLTKIVRTIGGVFLVGSMLFPNYNAIADECKEYNDGFMIYHECDVGKNVNPLDYCSIMGWQNDTDGIFYNKKLNKIIYISRAKEEKINKSEFGESVINYFGAKLNQGWIFYDIDGTKRPLEDF